MLIFSGIYKNAKENPHKICMSFGNNNIDYGEFVHCIDKRAVYLATICSKSEKIIIKNTNPINTIINFLACSRAGLAAIPINLKTTQSKMDSIIEKIKPFCIIDDKFIFKTQLEDQKCRLPLIEDSDIFLGALSSGTTGHNKVIWRDHKSWTSAFKYQSQVFHISCRDVLFLVGSLSYTGNLNSAMHILNEGGSIVFSSSIYPGTWIREMCKNNVTSIFMVPAHYRILLKELKTELENVKSILSAGDKIDSETVNLLKSKFPDAYVCEYYGASELGHVAYMDFRNNKNVDSVGKAFPQVKFWIQDDVVWVESPYIAPNFRPKATVGDIGKIDNEENLYILGRKNNTINKGGIKILPYNIEKILDNNPKILKSAVFGIKDSLKGEEICAAIVPKTNNITVKEVREYCRINLESYLQPRRIKIVQHLKLNSSGKIDYRNLMK